MTPTTLVLTLALTLLGQGEGNGLDHKPCRFNALCQCGSVQGSISAKSAPFSTHQENFPDSQELVCLRVPVAPHKVLPEGKLFHADLIGGDLEVLEADSLQGSHVQSIRLLGNGLKHIHEKAFRSSKHSLRSLEISGNQLEAIPVNALKDLSNLDWLSLHGNKILNATREELEILSKTLSSLYLGENHLTKLPDGGFSSFQRLRVLHLGDNRLSDLDGKDLPPFIQTLTLSNNHISSLKASALLDLPSLQAASLSGNGLESIASGSLTRSLRLYSFHLSDNFLKEVPNLTFDNPVSVVELYLEHNRIRKLDKDDLVNYRVERLYLGKNGLGDIHPQAFVSQPLSLLSLEGNSLTMVPEGIKSLPLLVSLHLSRNSISDLPPGSLCSDRSKLQILGLEGNHLTEFPSPGLQSCFSLVQLNLGGNYIPHVNQSHFGSWSYNLETLLLRNNKITSLERRSFSSLPRLRDLSLSFNRITDIPPEAFADLAINLQRLDLSFALGGTPTFPKDSLSLLRALEWLCLDNNDIMDVPLDSLRYLGNLRYLNLEYNRIKTLPVGVFNHNVHRFLVDLRLSVNSITEILTDTFRGLIALRSILMASNRITVVRSSAFRQLPQLAFLTLANNDIVRLEPKSFVDLPMMERLDLQDNFLSQLSLNAFVNVSVLSESLLLNLSSNHLESLTPGTSCQVTVLDLSHNYLARIPKEALEQCKHSLTKLYLRENRIQAVRNEDFKEQMRLAVLDLSKNNLAELHQEAFSGSKFYALQVLNLSHNRLRGMSADCFKGLKTLEVLDLSHNYLTALHPGIFRGSSIHRMDLSDNRLSSVPGLALDALQSTLRVLDLSKNAVQHVDSMSFPCCPGLTRLSLAENRLTTLPDNTFLALPTIVSLDLSRNNLKGNFRELFHYVGQLKELNLASTRMTEMPILPLPRLTVLNLSHNFIKDFSQDSVSLLRSLQELDLSFNQLERLHGDTWKPLPRLTVLDVSHNPVTALDAKAFANLDRLDRLSLQGLDYLRGVDVGALGNLTHLRYLSIDTYQRLLPRVSLATLLGPLRHLKELQVHLRENQLVDQLGGSFSPKLRVLEIRGKNLENISSKAFRGLGERGTEMLIRIRGTNVGNLPSGLLASFASRSRSLSLDLRENRLAQLSPNVFYGEHPDWEHLTTQVLQGGLAVDGNPLLCHCRLSWLIHWLRRWMRECRGSHLLPAAASDALRTAAARATCMEGREGRWVSLLSLRSDDLSCRALALSSGSIPSTLYPPSLVVILPLAMVLGVRDL
ncbi:unnamed protein product [Darwinula stevensoni]|uniref:Chaoptin n=1 Tax=Darwinula stevensoni TaxID=69355 RepID=A0A7R8XF39_9CRUS|nr:unnamed protein product [Darwinula stevensoni]CAG0890232.1 unnamed protein product [Darwinula stevensoni]